ncbi:Hcp family type VI secretion system effector [Methylomicrobium sp. RS1]|jgi:type VI secretion system secreted protein Hcp|uniref:Hcp family type VI secretion system effector n=1 Tax=Candidatus Methylomicrobium oryzae TaxID=2802053 RepID=UPI0019250FEC|nr:type VI secretion system tube protein Hcp [Methylomicrobium sp. RS1]MBL1265355.1 type VI secretion system tube protein Hcp [Methylomicrobium sp. RS1]
MAAYLQIEPIKGECTEEKHADWIQVLSYSIGVSQQVSGFTGTGGRSAGDASFGDLSVMKEVDKASIDLNLHCIQGKHIAKLVLEICEDTGEKICILKYELEDVMVSSVQLSGSTGAGRPAESVSFVYKKISWTYTPVKADGSGDTAIGPKYFDLYEKKSG